MACTLGSTVLGSSMSPAQSPAPCILSEPCLFVMDGHRPVELLLSTVTPGMTEVHSYKNWETCTQLVHIELMSLMWKLETLCRESTEWVSLWHFSTCMSLYFALTPYVHFPLLCLLLHPPLPLPSFLWHRHPSAFMSDISPWCLMLGWVY